MGLVFDQVMLGDQEGHAALGFEPQVLHVPRMTCSNVFILKPVS